MKSVLKAELVAQLEATLASARAAHASAIEGSTHEEARAENDKDTRGLEQSYLARGQAQRVAELEAAIGDVTALALRNFTATSSIAMSALVTVDEDGGAKQFFVAPAGGGAMLGPPSRSVQVVTPSSPLGRALIGKRVDDEVELQLPGAYRSFVITSVV
ncbi:MAG TPA: GreA/GreB family elongation factor [Kofleriaceae bacterium]|nr:GreA/GreB family elongation factor [Kofleriaceae bacterium]